MDFSSSCVRFSYDADVSARSFYEPILVTDFIAKYLNLRDFNRPLRDSDRVKVSYLMLIQQVMSLSYLRYCISSLFSSEYTMWWCLGEEGIEELKS